MNARTISGQQYDSARMAVDELERHGLAPSVDSFAVLSAHFARTHPELSARLNGMSLDADLTAEALKDLYLEHLAPDAAKAIEASTAVGKHTRDAVDAIAEAAQHTARYGEALDQSVHRLRSSRGDVEWREIVHSLMHATAEMRARTEVLERRLNRTHDEVARLRVNLLIAEKESRTDPLTGLANRKAFDEGLVEACKNAFRSNDPLCLVMCDIDHFKRVNDRWGHSVGDQVIKFVAGSLRAAGRHTDLVARYGGEEFALVADQADLEEASALAERVRMTLETKALRRRKTNEILGNITASFGVARYCSGESAQSLIERADGALYRAKAAGRNCVVTDATTHTPDSAAQSGDF